MKINTLINLADSLDEKGLQKEAATIDSFLKTSAKIPLHKCGLKEETIENHQELLESYEKAFSHYEKEYKKTMKSLNEKDSPNYGALRDILKNKTHNSNAIHLHNMYFEDILGKTYELSRSEAATSLLKAQYGPGPSQLPKDLLRAAKTSRNGWAVLNFNLKDKKLYLDIIDLHDISVSTNSIPVLAVDLWEHAYTNDFGLDKEAYVNWFFSRLDWRIIAKRIKNLNRLKEI